MTPPIRPVPTTGSFYLKPNVSSKRVGDLADLKPEESAEIAAKFNAALRSALATAIGPDKPGVANLVKTVALDYRELQGADLTTVLKQKVLSDARNNPALAAEVKSIEAALENAPPVSVAGVLSLDMPIRDHPILGKDFRKDKALAFAKLIKLPDALAAKLADKDLTLEDINAATLEQLVSEQIITKQQKGDLDLVINLSRLSGENLEMIKALKTDQLRSAQDLVSWDNAEWAKLIRDKHLPLPDGEDSIESYAGNLRDNISQTFPTQFLLSRVIKNKYDTEVAAVSSVHTLLTRNATIIDGTAINKERLDWTGIGAAEKQKISTDLDVALTFANTYRHLGLVDIINDKALTPAIKTTTIAQRLALLDTFYKNNPELDLHVTDFLSKGAQFKWDGIPNADRPIVRKQLMAYQRALTLARDYDASRTLLAKGLDAAMHIASLSEDEFRNRSGLDLEPARTIYLRALDQSVATSHYLEAVRDVQLGTFKEIALSNQVPLVNDLREIDGFDELFGTQNYCDCEHCRSIFGPAAYFADLMYFVEQNVSKGAFIPSRVDHPLYLKNRRPDLWKLKLTCQNTTTEIPYLDVVNDVLAQYIQHDLGVNDVFDMLRQSDLSCALPFNLPIEEVRVYLGHFELSLASVYEVLRKPRSAQQREKLRIAEEELPIVTTVNPAGAMKRFGNPVLADLDVQEFIRLAGISRVILDDLLHVTFLPEIAKVKVKTIKDPTDIQKYREVLQDLTDARLDLIHRFLRLWRHTPWTLREYELILSTLRDTGLLNNLEDADAGSPKILQVGDLVSIQEALSLTPEEVCAMAGDLPQRPVADNQRSLYERLFDLDNLFGVAAVAPDGTKTYNAQFTLPFDKTTDKKTPLLLAGLGIREAELSALLKLLGVNIAADVQVDRKLLSNLYRHARIARGLNLSIEELVAASAFHLSGTPVTQLSQIRDLMAFTTWLAMSPFTVAELRLILLSDESTALKYHNDVNSVAAAVLEIQKSDKTDKKALLKAYLQRTFSLTTDQLELQFLTRLVSVDIEGAVVATALATTFNNGEPDHPAELDPLVQLVREIERLGLLFSKLEFDAGAITYWIEHHDVFGIADLKTLTLSNLVNATLYHTLVMPNKDMEGRIRDALTGYQTTSAFSAVGVQVLADVWQRPARQVQSVVSALTLAPPALEAVRFVLEVQQVCDKLGIEGSSLGKLTATDYPGLMAARDVAIGAFASKYPDENTRKDKLEPYHDRINTLKRDALCNYIIARRDKFKFRDRPELYAFFLLDTEMSGCFRTSWLVAAITSVQLYVHRCLINLEQSDKALNPGIVDVKVNPTWIPADEWAWRQNYRVWEANRKVFLYPENYIDPTLRDNKTEPFRELEDELLQEKITKESAEAAYRKYLAQFAQLARLRYAGSYYHRIPLNFALVNVGKAVQAGVYFKVIGVFLVGESEDSGYYLFARTNVQPYQYYFRAYNHFKNVWGNWKKIELAIDAEEISPVIHLGRLHIFWTEVQSKEISKVRTGDSQTKGVVFRVFLKYSFLDEHGKWATPQRVNVGYTYSAEDKIYQRVEGAYPPNEDVRDREHDHVLEQYQRKVFRKPYARIAADIKTPIELSYIWSQNRGIQQVLYTSLPSGVTAGLGGFGQLVLAIPSSQFLITNSQFNVSKPVIAFGVFRVMVGGVTLATFDAAAAGTATLVNASSCLFSANSVAVNTSNFDLSISATAPVVGQAIPLELYASTFDLSTSRNALDENANQVNKDIVAKSNFRLLSDAAVSFLKDEYDKAFSENGDVVHDVEDGTKSFATGKRVLQQFRWGDGHLAITKSDGSVDTVSLTTILSDELRDVLYAKGLEQFLALETQQMTDLYGRQFDLKGAYGEYYREMFFHIPFLIANHLNANQRFADAKWWYERIFDPCAEESPADAMPTDRNWRYREFRNLTIQKLKDILTDQGAIEAYKKDPFNPHAIARLRLTAYQKTIVMRYIDNLIDWGDHLFAQDTRESINEAEMLYQLAADILGPRPVKLGKCETVKEDALTYETIGPAIGKGSEFLITLEHVYLSVRNQEGLDVKPVTTSKDLAALLGNAGVTAKPNTFAAIGERANAKRFSDVIAKWNIPGGPSNAAESYRLKFYGDVAQPKTKVKQQLQAWPDAPNFKDRLKVEPIKRQPGLELVKQGTMVFCVPPNVDLLKYWDRVEQQLFKIRNCMNISGVRRSLALFQPPIDPMLLVRARAAGLSLEDILAAAGKPPRYRFSYLADKAKQFAQTVQSFGAALLSALEKKDVEELTLLRSLHERNILKMTKDLKKQQLKESQSQYQAAVEACSNVQNRIDYYQGLLQNGLTGWEVTQQISKHAATVLSAAETVLRLTAGISYLLPQVGSPFAMKYGGKEGGDSQLAFSEFIASLARISDAVSVSAGLEASFQRRAQEWKQQLTLAQTEFKQSTQQMLAAEIRGAIAEKDLDIHDKNMEQAAELHDFYKDKLTSLGLYDYLSSTLNRLYREAYNGAYDMAKMAEGAYQFEIDTSAFFVANDNWRFDRAGLLAGESLVLQVQKMEQAYIENNARTPEITQSFSLALLDASQLVQLRQTGSCAIKIPKIAFEVAYPGQYKRLIRAVRLTIPCVVGPYTNVSAKLTLHKGEVEDDQGALTELPVGKDTSISASSANNDAGMFEFNFRDERYLPFEGAGAVSEWLLELPSAVRSFDYNTIADVVLHLSYTARDGDRATAETKLAAALTTYATAQGLVRLFSLKHEFPNALYQLLNATAGAAQKTDVSVEQSHFPYLFNGRPVNLIDDTRIYLKPKSGLSVDAPAAMNINGANAVTWTAADDVAMPGKAGKIDALKSGKVTLTGTAVKTWTIDAGVDGMNKDKIDDVLILIKYKVSA